MKEKSLAKLNQENVELRKENEALQQTVSLLIAEVEKLRNLPVPLPQVEEPVHQGFTTTSITINGSVERVHRSTEQNIIDEQIEHLYATSRGRMLSLEETRALDLLIKNKRLLEPKADHEPDFTKVPEGQTEADLLRLADVKTETGSGS